MTQLPAPPLPRAALAACWALAAFPAAAAPVNLTVLDFDSAGAGADIVGEVVALTGREFERYGVRLTASPNGDGTTLGLFNTDCDGPGQPACSGNDDDLATGPRYGTAPQGLALILNGAAPDGLNDDPDGGSITFHFTDPGGVNFGSFELLDIDEEDPLTAPDILFSFVIEDGTEAGLQLAEASVSTLAAAQALALTVENLSVKTDDEGAPAPQTGDNSHWRYRFVNNPQFFPVNADGYIENVRSATIRYDSISGAVGSITFDRPHEVPLPAAAWLLAAGLGALWGARRAG